MNITADKVKEAGYWCNQLLGVNNQYQSCLRGIKRFKGTGYKIGQVMSRWTLSVSAIWMVVSVMLVCRLLFNPTELSDSKLFFYNEVIMPIWRSFLIISILDFPISLFLGLKSVKKDLNKAFQLRDEWKKKLDSIIKEKMEIISIIPEKYRYPLATNYLAEVLECGRADSMKEALNLYEEQLHRWKMESKMESILKTQQNNNSLLWSCLIASSFR